ncbi:MAG: hypothetical protein JWM80_2847 [Cyanobacteria bacterium RYN_339]|nr:hypothetical protein [Cyanobacteria bacterium RYN_339]
MHTTPQPEGQRDLMLASVLAEIKELLAGLKKV